MSITERNLMGNGQFLRLQLSGSLERLQVNLSFTEPRFLDRNLAAGFDLFHKEVDQTSQSGFKSRRTGGSLRLGFPLSEKLWMQTNYTAVARPDLRRQPVAPRSPSSRPKARRYTSLVGTTLTYDLRNDAKNPTKGSVVPGGYRLRRPRRRRAVHQLRGRSARLLPDHRQHHLRRPRHRRLRSTAGAARTSASSTCSSRAVRRCAASIVPATVRAI